MKNNKLYQKAIKTNKISKDEAIEFFADLQKETNEYIRTNYKYYVSKGMWPLKARVPGGGQKDPVFIVIHHTGAEERRHSGAMSRFFQSDMASSNFLITNLGEILYLVPLSDQSFHATKRAGVIPIDVARWLKINDGRFLNEPGIEIVGHGTKKLFTPDQFEATIVLNRMICAYFGTVKELKSHKFFSPIDRSLDPGPFSLLPLIEHATFNDVDILDEEYWLQNYIDDQVSFVNDAESWMKMYNVYDRDEWQKLRKKLRAETKMLL